LTVKDKIIKLDLCNRILKTFYEALAKEDMGALRKIHIPRSEVFYVQKAIKMHTGIQYSLDHVERSMYLEGYLSSREVLDPHRRRGYCSYDHPSKT
tara:strand:+ start:371 stop:658 length:288 start_codon:yes stop_codon:yes gene_type:complete